MWTCVCVLFFALGYMPAAKGGGIRQRIRKRADRLNGPIVDPLVEGRRKMASYAGGGRKRAFTMGTFLSSMYAVGRMSAPDVQEGGECHVSTRSSSSTCTRLAKCGNRGKYRGNMHRDVTRALEREVKHRPQVYETKLSVSDNVKG